MKYRKFGSTGLEVSEVIFGAGAVGGILINADDETRRTAIKMALDAGINWIDSAASYGQGRSEEALGWLLKEVPATKATTYTYVNPVIAVFLGWLILDETITPITILSSAIIITAVILIQTAGGYSVRSK